jgi:hypothetical protein
MRTKNALMFGLVIIVFFSFLSVAGQQRFEDKRITLHLERVGFGKIIEVLVEKFDVAVSFEQSPSLSFEDTWDFDFEEHIPFAMETIKGVQRQSKLEFEPKKYWFSVNFDEAKLSDVMDSIVAQMPDYKWEINDGVVNIFPAKNRDDLFKKLLAVRIEKFDLDKPFLFQFQQEILAMPELIKFMNDNGLCTTDHSARSIINVKRKLPDEIHFSDLTLIELFNRSTKIKRGGWFLRRYRYSNGKECINIQI